MMAARSIQERFDAKWMPVTESGCWIWIGAKAVKGYGHFRIGAKIINAHRVAYELYRGPIPDTLQIDHLCRVRCCVNPWHLEAVSCAENLRRGIGAEVAKARKNRAIFCVNGHKYVEDNSYQNTLGYRECKICRVLRKRRYRKRKTQGLV